MAYDELQGDEWGAGEDLVGEDEFGRRVVRRAPPRPMRRAVQANRIEPLPFAQPTAVAAGVLMTAFAYPQRKFKPLRLVIGTDTAGSGTIVDSLTAPSYTITDLKIGAVSQLNNIGALPGDLFNSVAVGTSFSFGTAHVGHQVILLCTHGASLYTLPHSIVAAFLGKSYYLQES